MGNIISSPPPPPLIRSPYDTLAPSPVYIPRDYDDCYNNYPHYSYPGSPNHRSPKAEGRPYRRQRYTDDDAESILYTQPMAKEKHTNENERKTRVHEEGTNRETWLSACGCTKKCKCRRGNRVMYRSWENGNPVEGIMRYDEILSDEEGNDCNQNCKGKSKEATEEEFTKQKIAEDKERRRRKRDKKLQRGIEKIVKRNLEGLAGSIEEANELAADLYTKERENKIKERERYQDAVLSSEILSEGGSMRERAGRRFKRNDLAYPTRLKREEERDERHNFNEEEFIRPFQYPYQEMRHTAMRGPIRGPWPDPNPRPPQNWMMEGKGPCSIPDRGRSFRRALRTSRNGSRLRNTQEKPQGGCLSDIERQRGVWSNERPRYPQPPLNPPPMATGLIDPMRGIASPGIMSPGMVTAQGSPQTKHIPTDVGQLENQPPGGVAQEGDHGSKK